MNWWGYFESTGTQSVVANEAEYNRQLILTRTNAAQTMRTESINQIVRTSDEVLNIQRARRRNVIFK